jgi:hypothetical protein
VCLAVVLAVLTALVLRQARQTPPT